MNASVANQKTKRKLHRKVLERELGNQNGEHLVALSVNQTSSHIRNTGYIPSIAGELARPLFRIEGRKNI